MSMISAQPSEPVPTTADFRSYSGKIVRIVEAQHRISTDRLADGPAQQDILERLVEEVKPTMPAAAVGLHHLLATPFRYGHAQESRFRRRHERPGIFYASEKESTALAETAYRRLRFFAASPGVKLPTTTVEYWAFGVPVRVARALDLTASPLDAGRALWTDPMDYGPCQRLAATARSMESQLIRYESVRDPAAGSNVALFDASAFQKPVPNGVRTWHFRFRGKKLTAFAALPSNRRDDFAFEQFGLTPP